jgi:hypothetical protein
MNPRNSFGQWTRELPYVVRFAWREAGWPVTGPDPVRVRRPCLGEHVSSSLAVANRLVLDFPMPGLGLPW